MNTSRKTRRLAQLSVLVAIMLILSFTPLGFIPLLGLNATTMHIPVILGACMFGPRIGALLGLLFGITSVVRATVEPSIISFVFTPFYSFSPEFSGSWQSLIVAIVPRILIGVVAGYVFMFLAKRVKVVFALLAAGILGSLTNTAGVMFLIYYFFGDSFAMALHKPVSMLISVIMGVIFVNGITEAIVAAFINTALYKALAKPFGLTVPKQ